MEPCGPVEGGKFGIRERMCQLGFSFPDRVADFSKKKKKKKKKKSPSQSLVRDAVEDEDFLHSIVRRDERWFRHLS
jgi:hypothetical protein